VNKIGRREARKMGSMVSVSREANELLDSPFIDEALRLRPHAIERWLPWRPLSAPRDDRQDNWWTDSIDIIRRQLWEVRFVGRSNRKRAKGREYLARHQEPALAGEGGTEK
jgi:hypothetical protein